MLLFVHQSISHFTVNNIEKIDIKFYNGAVFINISVYDK